MTAIAIFAIIVFLAVAVASKSSAETEAKSRAEYKANPPEQDQEHTDIDKHIVENMVDITPSGGAIAVCVLIILVGGILLTNVMSTGLGIH